MSRDPLAAFNDLIPPGEATPDQYYPGSRRLRRAVAEPDDPWGDLPHVDLELNGRLTRFYYVRVLAEKLGRGTASVRKWERLGYVPSSGYRTPSATVAGQRRLYTREQIEGLVRIAQEEGLVGGRTVRDIAATNFPARAAQLFKELKQQ